MDRVDYNKALSSEKRKFYDTVSDLKDSHRRQVDGLKENYRSRLENKSENYQKELNAQQDRFESRQKDMQKYVSEELNNKKESLREQLAKTKKDFLSRSTKRREEYSQKLDDLNSQFARNLDEEKGLHRRLQNERKKNYKENLKDYKKLTDEKIESLNQEYTDASDRQRAERAKELRKSYEESQRKISNLQKDANIKRNELSSGHRKKFEDLRKSFDQNLEERTDLYSKNLESLKGKYKKNLSNSAKNFDDISRKRNEKFAESQAHQSLQHQKELKDLRENYEQKLAAGKSSGARTSKLDQAREFHHNGVELERERYDDRLAGIRKASEKHRRKLDEETQDNYRRITSVANKEKSYASQNAAEKIYEVNHNHQKNLAYERMKNSTLKENFEETTDSLTKERDRQLLLQQQKHKSEMNAMLNDQASKIRDLDFRYQRNIDGVRINNRLDKQTYDKEMKDKFADQGKTLRENYQSRMDKQSSGYERVIENLRTDNERLSRQGDDKFKTLQEEKADQLTAQREIYQEQLAEKEKEHYEDAKYREEKIQAEMGQLRREYNNKFTDQAIRHEKQVNHLTSEYEGRLRKQSRDFNKTVRIQQNKFNREKDLQKKEFEKREQRLIGHYENVIEDLKRHNEVERENLRRFAQEERLKG